MRSALLTALLASLIIGAPSQLGGQAPELAPAEVATAVEWADLAFEAKDRAAFQVNQLPEPIRRLEGKLIRVRGYFHLGTADREAREFLLLGEIKSKPTVVKIGCRPDELPWHQLAAVEMAAGKKASVTYFQPVAVTGRLSFKVVTIEGKACLVFRIAAESVEAVKPRLGYGPALTSGC